MARKPFTRKEVMEQVRKFADDVTQPGPFSSAHYAIAAHLGLDDATDLTGDERQMIDDCLKAIRAHGLDAQS